MAKTRRSEPSVEEHVGKLLTKWFERNPFNERKLGQQTLFNPSDNALLRPFYRQNAITIPLIPGISKAEPSLLLYNLGKESEHEKVQASSCYKYIDDRQQGPGTLYGTSGAGKTRSLLEYLSYNKGLYFVGQSSLAPEETGACDLGQVCNHHDLDICVGDDKRLIQINQNNLRTVEDRMITLLFIRAAVHDYVQDLLERDLTAFEWLMLQIYPQHYMGFGQKKEDIFEFILKDFIYNFGGGVKNTCRPALNQAKTDWKAIVIDESQMLSGKKEGYFLSDTGDIRSNFSAVFRALLCCKADFRVTYAIFSGTGMSIDEMKEESASALGKRLNLDKQPENCDPFIDFEILEAENVKKYLECFLELKTIKPKVVDHITKWLRGRPRFAATFLEEFLVRSSKPSARTTRGQFIERDALLIQALDRYIFEMTQQNRRASWTGGTRTPFNAINNVMDATEPSTSTLINDVRKDLEKAAYHVAMGGNDYCLAGSEDLIKYGVARLKPSASNRYASVLDEPLMVEAGINYFGLSALIQQSFRDRYNSLGVHDSFEDITLGVVRFHLEDLLKTTFPESNLGGWKVSTKSSYGTIAKSFKGSNAESIRSLLDWIESSIEAEFEGTVPPFCFPPEVMGPDVLTLLRDCSHTEYFTVLCQSKFTKNLTQSKGLETLVPEWLFYDNKSDEKKRTLSRTLKTEHLGRWNDLKPKLVGDDTQLLRCLVEYPVNDTATSCSSASVHRNGIKKCEDEGKCGEKHENLLTIDGEKCHQVLSQEFLRLLSSVKGEPKAKRQKRNRDGSKSFYD